MTILSRGLRTTTTQLGRRNFSFGALASERQFWSKTNNTGQVFLALLLFMPAYRTVKDMYWTTQMRALNKQEIVQDRYEWLQRCMLQDEVNAVLEKQAGKY